MDSPFSLWLRHLFLRADDRLLVIIAYADETGHPCDPDRHIFGFGGFIGRVANWESFAVAWQDICPPEFYPFHMTEFVRQTHRNDERQRAVLGPLVGLIRGSQIVPISVFCHVPDFREADKPLTDKEGGELYQAILGHFFCQVGVSVLGAQELDPPSGVPRLPSVSIVFAQRKFAGMVCNWWDEHRELGTGPLSTLVSGLMIRSVSVATPETVVPLQAADLWAWEVGHHYEKGKPRWTYDQIREMAVIPGLASPLVNRFDPFELLGNTVML